MMQIQTCARDNAIAVSLGFSENSNNSIYIAQVLIGPDGEIKCHRRKMKPTHMERTVFGDASGECFASVAALPFARVGALSCWEHIQPLLKYSTFSQGEDIHVAAWPSLTPHSGKSDLWSMSAEGESCRCSLRRKPLMVRSRLPKFVPDVRYRGTKLRPTLHRADHRQGCCHNEYSWWEFHGFSGGWELGGFWTRWEKID